MGEINPDANCRAWSVWRMSWYVSLSHRSVWIMIVNDAWSCRRRSFTKSSPPMDSGPCKTANGVLEWIRIHGGRFCWWWCQSFCIWLQRIVRDGGHTSFPGWVVIEAWYLQCFQWASCWLPPPGLEISRLRLSTLISISTSNFFLLTYAYLYLGLLMKFLTYGLMFFGLIVHVLTFTYNIIYFYLYYFWKGGSNIIHVQYQNLLCSLFT